MSPRERERDNGGLAGKMGKTFAKMLPDGSILFCCEHPQAGPLLPPEPLEPTPMADAPAHWRWLSDLEQQIHDLLRVRHDQPDPQTGEWMSREAIAEALNESAMGRIRGVLSNLAERRILDADGRRGYRLSLNQETGSTPAL